MRFPDLIFWFATLFFVTAHLPKNCPAQVRGIFRFFVATFFFFLIGVYWLTTGEKFDESAYRLILCRVYPFPRCTLANEVQRIERETQEAEAERRRQAEA